MNQRGAGSNPVDHPKVKLETDMLCKRCGVAMTHGVAIKPQYEHNAFYHVPAPIPKLQMINVLKCPKCGHSENVA